MGGMVGGEQKSHGKKGKKSFKKPRMAVRVDMTPMVDVAFLLLIFFMVTTVFRLPQAMEINLPPENKDVTDTKVRESRMLTFRINNSNQLFFNVGNEVPAYLPWDSLNSKIIDRKKSKDDMGTLIGQELIVVSKLQPQAPFHSMVDMLDMFNVDSVTRYSVAKWNADMNDDSVMSLVSPVATR